MKRLLMATLATLLAGCGGVTLPTHFPANLPNTGTVIPSTSINLSPSVSMPLEKLVYWGAYASAAYLIIDPFAPNWEIEEAKFPGDRYHMALHMKRVYSGGAGEARAVFHHRAAELMRGGEYDSYQVVEYTEGMESSAFGSQRVAAGVIQLTKKD